MERARRPGTVLGETLKSSTLVSRGLAVAALVFTNAFAAAGVATLSFEERLEAQRAIEEVYWRHREWPAQNPAPKPPLSAVLPESTLREKVEPP